MQTDDCIPLGILQYKNSGFVKLISVKLDRKHKQQSSWRKSVDFSNYICHFNAAKGWSQLKGIVYP